jgi:hypothetical protein
MTNDHFIEPSQKFFYMSRFFFLCSLSLVLMTNCNNNSDSAGKSSDTTPPPPPLAATLPSIPLETMQMLWEKCDYVDYLFYELPISMSLNEQTSIRYALRQVAADPAPLKPECKPIGRVFFQVKGENAAEADIFFTTGCTYFVFYVDGKKTYSNYMTEEGIQHLNNTLMKAKALRQKVK